MTINLVVCEARAYIVDVRPLVYIDKNRAEVWMNNLHAMSQGIEGFYKKREKDVLESYRDLLPSAQRNSFKWLALRFLASGDLLKLAVTPGKLQ